SAPARRELPGPKTAKALQASAAQIHNEFSVARFRPDFSLAAVTRLRKSLTQPFNTNELLTGPRAIKSNEAGGGYFAGVAEHRRRTRWAHPWVVSARSSRRRLSFCCVLAGRAARITTSIKATPA